jgi:hypothetical protein
LQAAPTRRPLAEAIVDEFSHRLQSVTSRPKQEWWLFTTAHWSDVQPLGKHPGHNPAWLTASANCFFTVNPTPISMRGVLGLAWDESRDDLTRWAVTVAPTARIYEIQRPQDWAELATRHPDYSRTGSYEGWEINPHPRNRGFGWDELASIPDQRAGRQEVRRFVEPEWAAVAEEWDAVHLSWAGFLTSEGTISDLGDGDVAMLRGWGSERTLWLNPVLTDPTPIHPDPADPPSKRWHDPGNRTVDLRLDPARLNEELALLNRWLNLE